MTRSPHWSLRLDGEYVELSVSGQQYRLRVDDDQQVQVHRGVFWSRVELQTGDAAELCVDGLPNGPASRLAGALQHLL
ncbi:hypothetical protein, partial [Enterobacter hormaechei]|uniref:hypothetical protein n=1 Tax=Enterobacter hormaechei TaxID=158836 RepID=UPI00203DA06D